MKYFLKSHCHAQRAKRVPGHLLLYFSLILSLTHTLQAGSFTAEVDRTEIEKGETLQLSLTLSGKAESEPSLDSLSDFDILSQGQSSNIQITNGSMTHEISYNYLLQPKRDGNLTIPSFSLTIDGEKISTLPISIKIGKSSNNKNENQDDIVKLERTFSQSEAFVGEPIITKLKIYHRIKISDPQLVDRTPSDFRRIKGEKEKQYDEILDGKKYHVLEIKEALIPLKPGRINFPGHELHATIAIPRTNNRGGIPQHPSGRNLNQLFDQFFDSPFFGASSLVEKSFFSSDQELNIYALPKDQQPKNFNGLVGDYQLYIASSNIEANTGDTITLTITLEGKGDLEGYKLPSLGLDSNFRIYEDKPEYTNKIEDDHLQSKAIYKLALVPKKPGEISLSNWTLDEFHPKEKKYISLSPNSMTLKVSGQTLSTTPPHQQLNTAPTLSSDLPTTPKEDDIFGLHRNMDWDQSHYIAPKNAKIILFLSMLPGFLWTIFFIFRFFKLKNKKNLPNLLRKKSLKNFNKKIDKEFLDARSMMKYFKEFLSELFSVETTSWTLKDLKLKLGDLLSKESMLLLEKIWLNLEKSEYHSSHPVIDNVEIKNNLKKLALEAYSLT